MNSSKGGFHKRNKLSFPNNYEEFNNTVLALDHFTLWFGESMCDCFVWN